MTQFQQIGGAFFQQSEQGLQAVSDPQTLRGLQSGEIQVTKAPTIAPRTGRFSPTITPTPVNQIQSQPQFEPPQPRAFEAADQFAQSAVQQVNQARTALEQELESQRKQAEEAKKASETRFQGLTDQMKETLEGDIQPLLQPFRADIETSERKRLEVERNFFENQQLVNELETLLTGVQTDLQAAKDVTGLSSVRQPRIEKSTQEAMSRVGVIEATMEARNGQINTALNFIDRTLNAVTQDRRDELSYYEALLGFQDKQRDEDGRKLLNLEKEEKDLVNQQVDLIRGDLQNAERYADNIKQMMLDPGTATMLAKAGVTLSDSPEEVSRKIAQWGIAEEKRQMDNKMAGQGFQLITEGIAAGKPSNEITRLTDNQGNTRVYWNPEGVSGDNDFQKARELFDPSLSDDANVNRIREGTKLSISDAKRIVEEEKKGRTSNVSKEQNIFNAAISAKKNDFSEDAARDLISSRVAEGMGMKLSTAQSAGSAFDQLSDVLPDIASTIDDAVWLQYNPDESKKGDFLGIGGTKRSEIEKEFNVQEEATPEVINSPEANSARQFISDNPNLSDEELKEGIFMNTNLSLSEIDKLVDQK